MTDSTDRTTDRLVAAMFGAGLLGLLLLLFNQRALFGLTVCAVLLLGLALGYSSGHLTRPIRLTLLALFAADTALLTGMVLSPTSGPLPRLVFGFPAPTALLVYGIWPLPLLAGLLYALVFRSNVLPEDKLERFLAEHSRRRGAR